MKSKQAVAAKATKGTSLKLDVIRRVESKLAVNPAFFNWSGYLASLVDADLKRMEGRK